MITTMDELEITKDYIKELEQREKINIKRISGCSIGAVLGLLFMLNKMDISIDISTYAFKCLRKHQHLKPIIFLNEVRKHFGLLRLFNHDQSLRDCVNGGVRSTDRDFNRID